MGKEPKHISCKDEAQGFPGKCINHCKSESNWNSSFLEILHLCSQKIMLKQKYNPYTQFIFSLEFLGFFPFCSSGKQSTCIFKDVSFPINFSGHTPHILKNVKTLTTGIEFSAVMSIWLWGCNTDQIWHVRKKGPWKKKVCTNVRSCQNK